MDTVATIVKSIPFSTSAQLYNGMTAMMMAMRTSDGFYLDPARFTERPAGEASTVGGLREFLLFGRVGRADRRSAHIGEGTWTREGATA